MDEFPIQNLPNSISLIDVESSRCVKVARKQISLKQLSQTKIDLRNIEFGTKFGSKSQACVLLTDLKSSLQCGLVSYCKGYGGDPVHDYLVASIAGSNLFEAIRYRSNTSRVEIFNCAKIIASVNEIPIVQTGSIWKRVFQRSRKWEVHNEKQKGIGKIHLQYPISKTSVLKLILGNGETLPIGLASGFLGENSKVIPVETNHHSKGELLLIHFLIVICFRLMIVQIDIGGS